MAVGEPRKDWQITQVSWTDGTAQDVYYWQEHSFQYSANINCDDEMHWIKLSQAAEFESDWCSNCQLVSVWSNWVIALNVKNATNPRKFDHNSFGGGTTISTASLPKKEVCPWVVFQDKFWFGTTTTIDGQTINCLDAVNNTWAGTDIIYTPIDHPDYTDESISTPIPNPANRKYMQWPVTAILNYNNTRLVVACNAWLTDNTTIWVYYPELDRQGETITIWWQSYTILPWETGWKKVLQYEAWVTVVWLTCTFEYLKVWAVDEGWNTKVYYYQGNNNLRSTFVYNVVDLTGVRVTRVYSINGIDYYVSSQDWTDGFVNLYKMVWNTPVSLFHQRAWLDPLDVNFKAPYFVWPCGIEAGYTDWTFYIADTYGLFRFKYTPQGYDKGYMKWKFRTNQEHPYWVCFNQGYLYVSTDKGCYKMRAYDTGKDGYQEKWVLISREFEGSEWGTITKMLDEIRLNFELNPLTNYNWEIDVYVSPNNLWKNTHTFTEANNWYHAMHIDQTNIGTRTEKSNLFNDMWGNEGSSFKFDWQTITYAIVITRYTAPSSVDDDEDPRKRAEHATPIVRQIDIKYHTKDKVNKVYTIK